MLIGFVENLLVRPRGYHFALHELELAQAGIIITKNMQLKELYHQDLNLWRQEIINAIQNQQLENMDWDNLIDEINDLTASYRRALRSYTKRLM